MIIDISERSKKAMRNAAAKLPIKTKFVKKEVEVVETNKEEGNE